MDLRSFFRRRRTTSGAKESTPAAGTPTTPDPLAPERAEDVEQAWIELRKAAEGSGVRTFRACARDGSRWEDDPAAVRRLAAILRSLKETDTATGGDTAR